MSAAPDTLKNHLRGKREAAQRHEHTCSFEIGSYVETATNGDSVRRHKYCTSEAKWVLKVTYAGHETVEYVDQKGKKHTRVLDDIRLMPVRYGALCEEHRSAVSKNPSLILTPLIIQQQQRDFVNQGYPKMEPKLTKMSWVAYTPHAESVADEGEQVLDFLQEIAEDNHDATDTKGQ